MASNPNDRSPRRRRGRVFIVSALAVLVACAAPSLARAHGVQDQVNDPASFGQFGCVGSVFQSFTPTASTLAAVDLRIGYNAGSTRTHTINIRSGSETGLVLGTATTTQSSPVTGFFLTHFDFAAPIALTPGATYVIELLTFGPWVQTSGNPYPGGNMSTRCGDRPLETFPDRDLSFITYAVPPPLTLTPTTATNPVGQPHTVTATLQLNGQPVAGAVIAFNISPTTGVPPPSVSSITNASGQASITFTSTIAGTYTVTACAALPTGVCPPGSPTTTATKTFVDVTPPTCVVVLGANQIRVTANDPESGLTGIAVTAQTNVSLSGAPASFSPPAFGAQVVVATRINRTLPMRLALLVTNAAGLSTPCDPILSTLAIGKRNVVSRSYSGIPYLENELTIRALRGGPLRAAVQVNGRVFRFAVNGQKRISLAKAMTHIRSNKVKITLYGKAGARALVALTD